MSERGLYTDAEIVADGKIKRFHVEGDSNGKENGWYVLHIDRMPAGAYGSWKTNERFTWSKKLDRKLTAEERRALEERITAQRRAAEEERAKINAEAAARAKELWPKLPRAETGHAYLVTKSILPHVAKQTAGGALTIPMKDAVGELHSLQFIAPDGEKRFLYGGRVEGCYCALTSPPPVPTDTIALCEGFATGATIFEATGIPTIVAFNAGNLLPVAKSMRSKYPTSAILICADNDQWTETPVKNPGVYFATIAAETIGNARVVVPDFPAEPAGGNTDWNDYAKIHGLPRVREIILSHRTSAGEGQTSAGSTIHSLPASPVPPPATEAAMPDHLIDEPAGPFDPSRFPVSVQWQDMNGDGKPLPTIENVRALLDTCGIKVFYDVIRKDLDIRMPGAQYLIDTARNDKMTRIISIAGQVRLQTQKIPEFVSYIGGQNPYNPVAEWVLSRPWDGESRLRAFFDTLTAVGEADVVSGENTRRFKETLMQRWMISAIAAAFEPKGVSAHGVLVLQGAQYLGKTAWFKSLVPQDLELTADGMLLDPKDKDSVYQIVTNWLVELGEVDATFKKADIAQLKAFITKDRDILRRPYARSESAFARRTVFFASVNERDYLADPTGNRRFWTIECSGINFRHGLEIQQVWAEFHDMYRRGESWYLSPEEMTHLNAHNREFEVISPVEERIRAALNWDAKPDFWRSLQATEVAIEVGIHNPTPKDVKAVGKAIREITGKGSRKTNGKYVYFVPPRHQRDDPYYPHL